MKNELCCESVWQKQVAVRPSLETVFHIELKHNIRRNEEVLLRVNEQSNILHEIRKRKADWVGHILRRNCLQQQVIEGKTKGQIEVTR